MAGTSPAMTTVFSSIIHPHQIEPLRRRDRAAGGAVLGGQCCGEIVHAPAALAHPNQRAHHRTHLAVQERARRGHDGDGIAISHDIELIERSLRRFGLAFGLKISCSSSVVNFLAALALNLGDGTSAAGEPER